MRLLTSVFLFVSVLSIAAQERDVVPGSESQQVDVGAKKETIIPGVPPGGKLTPLFTPGVTPDWSVPLRYQPFVFANNFNTVNAAGAVMPASWDGGGIVVTGSRISLPGLLGHESGKIAIVHEAGPFTLQAAVGADKFGYFRGLTTIYSVSGSVTYRISEPLAFTVFGSYASRARGMEPPAVAGYMPQTSFGGYLTWDISEKWGVDVGAVSEYNPMTGRQEVRPMAVPYFKMGDAKLGMDVGAILYEVLRSRGSGGRGNPTMGPPIGRPNLIGAF